MPRLLSKNFFLSTNNFLLTYSGIETTAFRNRGAEIVEVLKKKKKKPTLTRSPTSQILSRTLAKIIFSLLLRTLTAERIAWQSLSPECHNLRKRKTADRLAKTNKFFFFV